MMKLNGISRVSLTLLCLLLLMMGTSCGRAPESAGPEHGVESPARDEIWTCSMHPQIRQPKPGQCPICGMDLIPVSNDAASGNDQPRRLTLSPAARKLAEVEVAPVERLPVEVEVRLVGKVQFDETRQAYISPRVPGRIDRLYANFVGMAVTAGDHLADMYSPDLVSAQQELLQAAAGGAGFVALLHSTRERLRLWGLTPEQIAEIERSGKVRDHLTFYAPIGGVVVEKEAREGMYVETGMRLFTVADLTHVWVELNAYESDLAWLRYAQDVTFESEAYPGEVFKGIISFIEPLLDPMTRTVKVRVNVPNPDGRLKPGMFVRAIVRAAVTADGKVMPRDLSGKWISPMHPEIVKNGPGACDVCGMPLVRAEELGYAVADATNAPLPLVIPATAPLLTGMRAVVYVAVTEGEGVYEGRDVVLGPRAGPYYLVREGLAEGEQVVVNGAFKIDSSLQIQGKPSMMAPARDEAAGPLENRLGPDERQTLAEPEAFRSQVDAVLDAVLAMADALAADDMVGARVNATRTRYAWAQVDMTFLPPEAHDAWMEAHGMLTNSVAQMSAAATIASFRSAFSGLSNAMRQVLKTIGPVRSGPIHVMHCPMAFENKGAIWLQRDDEVRNPYFGKSMLTCGEIVGTFEPEAIRENSGHE